MFAIFFLANILIMTTSITCPANCQYCLQQNICQACNKGYILSNNANCLVQTVPNCRVQLNATHCSICEPTFQPNGKDCIKDNSGCVVRNGLGKCEYCWFGTKLNQNGCIGIINCEIVLSNGRCGKCSLGYSLVGQSCIQSREQCAVKQGGVCTKCNARFILNGLSCIPETVIPPFCSLFDYTTGRCFICNIGYELYHKYCQRKDRIPFITSASSSSSPSSPRANALSMQMDTLSNSDTPTVTNSDFITQDYADIEITVKIGMGKVNAESCWQYGNNRLCVVCFEGYYLQAGKCIKSKPQCLQFDSQGRLCSKCRPELQLSNGNCLDPNCGVQIFSRCSKCKIGYSPNVQGICMGQNCILLVSGKCTNCSAGYSLSSSNLCVPITSPNSNQIPTSPSSNAPKSPTNSTAPAIIGCDLVRNGVCVRCLPNFYPNDKGRCKRIIIGCLKYDPEQLNCIQCIPIYKQTSDGGCLYEEPTPTTPPDAVSVPSIPSDTQTVAPSAPPKSSPLPPTVDLNCEVRNNGSCAICKTRYFLNLYNFSCQPVGKECLTYNETNGYCLSCASGFNLYSRWCLPKYSNSDPNCQINEINNYCNTCKPQFYKSRGQCFPVNTECKTFDPDGGECLTCYSGYIIINRQCIILSKQPSCIQYDFQQICIKCAQRYYLQQSTCIPVNPLCNNYNPTSGICTDCVVGYGLSSLTGGCEVVGFAPANCQKADQVGNCLSCSNRYYYNSTVNTCTAILSLCATYAQRTGQCFSCYVGFTLLADNSCVGKNAAQGCVSANPTGLCLSCSPKYILTTKGNCLLRDPNCVTYDLEANCTICRTNFYPSSGRCVGEVKKATKDANCLRSNLNNYCIQCNSGFYIESGNCLLADQLCRSYDPNNGYCLTCYDGYRLNLHKCYLNSPIFNCKRFDGSVCEECENGYKVGTDGSCVR